MKKNSKRFLSLLLVLTMLMSHILPITAFAQGLPKPEIVSSIVVPEFDDAEVGYDEFAYSPVDVVITSSGDYNSTYMNATLSGENPEAFDLYTSFGGTLSAPNTWDIILMVRPVEGLEIGTYTATLTLSFDSDENGSYETVVGSGELSFTVTEEAPVSTTVNCIKYWGTSNQEAIASVTVNGNAVPNSELSEPVELEAGTEATLIITNAEGFDNPAFFLRYDAGSGEDNYAGTDLELSGDMRIGTFIVPAFDFKIGIDNADARTEITSIELDGEFSMPVVGEEIPAVDYPIASVNNDEGLNNLLNVEYMKWQIKSGDGDWDYYDVNGTFESGEQYRLRMFFNLKEEYQTTYKFAGVDIEVTLSGEELIPWQRNDSTLGVWTDDIIPIASDEPVIESSGELFTVNFHGDENGEPAVTSIQVPSGETIFDVIASYEDICISDSGDYIFDGWKLADSGEEFDLYTPITSDIDLYPVWTLNEIEETSGDVFTVTFHGDENGEPALSSLQVPSGDTINNVLVYLENINIADSGDYTFGGWRLADSEVQFALDTPIYSDIDLYPIWIQNEIEETSGDTFTVIFDGNGILGTIYELEVESGESVEDVLDLLPEEEGWYNVLLEGYQYDGSDCYRYDGYTYDVSGEIAFGFADVITGDTTVYAKWLPCEVIEQVEFTVETPDAGTTVTISGEDPNTQYPYPVVTVPDGVNYELDNYEDLLLYGYWCTDESGEEYLTGTMEPGMTYYAKVYFRPISEDYVFSRDLQIIVNSGDSEGVEINYFEEEVCIMVPVTIAEAEEESGSGSHSGGGGGSSSSGYKITTKIENGKITPSNVTVKKNGSQEFKFEANKGYEITDVLVDGKSVGVVSSYVFEKVTSRHTIEVITSKVGESSSGKSDNGFIDVKPEDWFYEYVNYVAEKGIFNGVSKDRFAPNDYITRGMLVTVLYRFAGATDTEKSTFDDVDKDKYYSAPIAWAAKNGYVNGVGDNKFAPDAKITREDLASIIYRYLKSQGKGFVGTWMFLLQYDDKEEISAYAYEPICYLTMNGILNGKGNNNIDPKGNATRAETAKIIKEIADLLAK